MNTQQISDYSKHTSASFGIKVYNFQLKKHEHLKLNNKGNTAILGNELFRPNVVRAQKFSNLHVIVVKHNVQETK